MGKPVLPEKPAESAAESADEPQTLEEPCLLFLDFTALSLRTRTPQGLGLSSP